ncbi:MAG TPA: hypothetical protein VL970_09490, partial [Candidatus Acidoferrales bacterium]|nr:hypothetical protein [Candidatus Acidoferrales bacterium]
NRWYAIKIEVADGRIRCYLDGVLIHDLVDNAGAGTKELVASCVKDTKTGEVILKLVNVTAEPVQSEVNLMGIGQVNPAATRTVLAGSPQAEDNDANPAKVVPVSADFQAGKSSTSELPAYSLTVVRFKTR